MMSSPPDQGDTNAVVYNGGVDWDDAARPNADDFSVEYPRPQAPKTSNMWFAAAYNITAIIGVGVLGLPHAMVFLTWRGGVVVLVLAFAMTFFTLRQLIELHEFEFLNKQIRYGTYHALGARAYPTWGFRIVVTLQMIVEVSLDVLFTVAAGEAMTRIYDKVGSDQLHIFVWFAAFAAIQFFCSLAPDFDAIKWIVVFSAIMSVCYSSISWITILCMCDDEESVHHRWPRRLTVDHDVDPRLESLELTNRDLVLRACNSIGVVAFAYAAHNVVLEIQNGIPSSPARSSEGVMFRSVLVTYLVVALCYFPIAIAVYQNRGNRMSQNVLSFMQYHVDAPTGLVIAVNVMLILHLVGSYQVFAQPVFKLLEERLLKIGSSRLHFKRISVRFFYIVFATLLAMVLPYFSPLLGFFGGIAVAPTTYFLPCFLWLELRIPRKWSRDWNLNVACIILGIILMIVACCGGAYLLVKELHNKHNWNLWTSEWKDTLLYSTKIIRGSGSSCKVHSLSPPPIG